MGVKLEFIAKIESIGAISNDGKRRQTIQLKDVVLMEGYLFDESDGFVRITIERAKEEIVPALKAVRKTN